ncbi:MAG: AGZA family xanthine/uracil permease-like MFS transporter [Pirellulaceae bacterium]|jgi:AGZA family xanthine/uracil permease-like MFS transporter
MLDNIADLVLTVSLLTIVFEFPTNFALQNMVPGTAIGVLVGDLLFFWMALSLAKRLGRSDVTAMPLGLDTPSTFGMVFFVLGPAFVAKKAMLGQNSPELNAEQIHIAATYAWHIGICTIVISGLFKFVCAAGSNWVRRVVPRAGLLGSLTAVALVLISFLPLIEVLHFPIAGLAALAVILTSLVARMSVPGRVPGALASLLIGIFIFYLTPHVEGMFGVPDVAHVDDFELASIPTGWLSVFTFAWVNELRDSLIYLPVVIPFALGTVIGGIDCTESAAAAGDEYDTGRIISVEALATLIAGLCGGVIQTTPYIGHPAYKAMGGRAAYTLATAIFVGGAGLLGYFGFLYAIIPKASVFPILIFIGLEITAQSFKATPKRHYPAIGLACVPALAALVLIYVNDLQGTYSVMVGQMNQQVVQLDDQLSSRNDKLQEIAGRIREQDSASELADELDQLAQPVATLDTLKGTGEQLEKIAGNKAKGIIADPPQPLGKNLFTLHLLSGGFIVTSLLWASALAAIIDRRFAAGATYFGVAAACSLFGIIHSPLPGSPMVIPWDLPSSLPHSSLGQTPIYMTIGYLVMAGIVVVFGLWSPDAKTEMPEDE